MEPHKSLLELLTGNKSAYSEDEKCDGGDDDDADDLARHLPRRGRHRSRSSSSSSRSRSRSRSGSNRYQKRHHGSAEDAAGAAVAEEHVAVRVVGDGGNAAAAAAADAADAVGGDAEDGEDLDYPSDDDPEEALVVSSFVQSTVRRWGGGAGLMEGKGDC